MSIKYNTYNSRLAFYADCYANRQLTVIPLRRKALKVSTGDFAIGYFINVTSDAYDENFVGISNVD